MSAIRKLCGGTATDGTSNRYAIGVRSQTTRYSNEHDISPRNLELDGIMKKQPMSLYKGTCPTCNLVITARMDFPVLRAIPPPSVDVAHDCQIPVTGVKLIYQGTEEVVP